jgi:hypothetical protein
VEERGYPSVKHVCFDEIATHKGHGNYRLVISAPELGLVFAPRVLHDRKKETLEAWFLARGKDWCAYVDSYCADMWDAYQGVAQVRISTFHRIGLCFAFSNQMQAWRVVQGIGGAESIATILEGCWRVIDNRLHRLYRALRDDLPTHETACFPVNQCDDIDFVFLPPTKVKSSSNSTVSHAPTSGRGASSAFSFALTTLNQSATL